MANINSLWFVVDLSTLLTSFKLGKESGDFSDLIFFAFIALKII